METEKLRIEITKWVNGDPVTFKTFQTSNYSYGLWHLRTVGESFGNGYAGYLKDADGITLAHVNIYGTNPDGTNRFEIVEAGK